MKKHITPKQWEELTDEQRGEYLKFNKSTMAEHYIDISDMIEFLGNNFDKFIFDSGGGRLTGAYVGEYQNKVKPKSPTFLRQHFPCTDPGRFLIKF